MPASDRDPSKFLSTSHLVTYSDFYSCLYLYLRIPLAIWLPRWTEENITRQYFWDVGNLQCKKLQTKPKRKLYFHVFFVDEMETSMIWRYGRQ